MDPFANHWSTAGNFPGPPPPFLFFFSQCPNGGVASRFFFVFRFGCFFKFKTTTSDFFSFSISCFCFLKDPPRFGDFFFLLPSRVFPWIITPDFLTPWAVPLAVTPFRCFFCFLQHQSNVRPLSTQVSAFVFFPPGMLSPKLGFSGTCPQPPWGL